MQIALCHENVLPKRGGAEMYVADLARRLVVAGHEVHLYAAQWDDTALQSQIVKHPLKVPSGSRRSRPWKFSSLVINELAKQRPHVSVGFDKVLGTDVYYPLGGLHVACAENNLRKHAAGWKRWLAGCAQSIDPAQRSFQRLERQLTTGTDRPTLVANSNFVRRHFQSYYGVDPVTVPVIHNAIDPNRFDESDRPLLRTAMRSQWNLKPTEVVVAVIAMNYRLKGLEPLLRSIRFLPANSPVKLLVAGSPKIAPWQKLAARLGIAERVRFIGHCDDVRRVLFAADLMVHPTYYDPCSLVVLEAISCGLPVITTKNNGASELLPADAGTAIDDPNDVSQLADAIAFWSDANRRRAGSLAARAAASCWTMDHHVRALERVLTGVAEKRRRMAG